jgi:hypothetical protein
MPSTERPQQTTVNPLVVSTSAPSDEGSFCSSSLSEAAATARLKSSVTPAPARMLSLDLDLIGPMTRGLNSAAPVFTGGRSNFLSGSSNLVSVLAERDGDESAPAPPTAALVEPALVHTPPGVARDGVFGSFTSGGNSFDSGSLPPPETELEVEDSWPELLIGEGVAEATRGPVPAGCKRDRELLLLLEEVPFERL